MTNLFQAQLQQKLTELAETHRVPGAAVGVTLAGESAFAFHGVTSVENPLPVDANTLFQTGSTGKTYTATAMMRLVEAGLVDLHAPVKNYLPGFTLRDKDTEAGVTVLQLFNHTSGWDGDVMTDTGPGDDALEKYVALLADVAQVTPLGSEVSYNNAALSVAGALIAAVTGKIFEVAMHDLLFVPLGLTSSFFFRDDVMTRRFCVGHELKPTGELVIQHPWGLPRGSAPAGGITSTPGDYLAWAQFHLGDGSAPDGTRVLSAELLARMQEPTVSMAGSALGDFVGVSWLIRDVDGQRIVEHGGTMNGQHSELAMVPAKNFALTVNVNSGPNGPELIEELRRWMLETYVGITLTDPVPVPLADGEAAAYVGSYDTVAVTVEIVATADGLLDAHIRLKPEAAATLDKDAEDDDEPPFSLGVLADRDKYVIPTGPGKGMTGFFRRATDGSIDGIHLGGRLATRV